MHKSAEIQMILKLANISSRIFTFWVLLAAIVVSEISDILSPNIAPPTAAPKTIEGLSPKFCAIETAIGTIAAIVPQEVPIASEIRAEITNKPSTIKRGGTKCSAILTAASTPPAAEAAAVNAPARIKIRHIIIMSLLPMPSAKSSIFLESFSLWFKIKAAAEDMIKAAVIGTFEKSRVQSENPK